MIRVSAAAGGGGTRYTYAGRMASVYLVKRQTKKGARWYVRAEGIEHEVRIPATEDAPAHIEIHRSIIHLGVFDTERRARLRKDAALDEIARGRIPKRAHDGTSATTPTIQEAIPTWLARRHDLAGETLKNYTRSLAQLPAWLTSKQPDTITHLDVQRYIDELIAAKRARGTIERDIIPLRGLLDDAGVVPNPTLDRRVRLPRRVRKQHRLPDRAQILLLHEALPQFRDLMILLEHTGLRIHEAAALRWSDFDYKRDRFLVQDSKTSAGRRWVERLPDAPAFPRPPKGTDPNARVFGPPSTMDLTTRIGKAHKADPLVPLFSAHDWRHLHVSRLLHQQILSPAQIAARLGHADPGVTLRVYSTVVPPDD